MNSKFAVSIIISAALFFFTASGASAYAINTSQSSSFDLFLPFETFIQNISSIGSSNVRFGSAAAKNDPSGQNVNLEKSARSFGDWLNNIVGFHITDIFAPFTHFVSNIVSWIADEWQRVAYWIVSTIPKY